MDRMKAMVLAPQNAFRILVVFGIVIAVFHKAATDHSAAIMLFPLMAAYCLWGPADALARRLRRSARTEASPGGESALLHRHTKQDEFIYVLQGMPTLVTDSGEVQLSPGMCAGFPAEGIAHQLVNRTGSEVAYLEIGDRTPGDEGSYPRDDLKAALGPQGTWVYTHKDGRPY